MEVQQVTIHETVKNLFLRQRKCLAPFTNSAKMTVDKIHCDNAKDKTVKSDEDKRTARVRNERHSFGIEGTKKFLCTNDEVGPF